MMESSERGKVCGISRSSKASGDAGLGACTVYPLAVCLLGLLLGVCGTRSVQAQTEAFAASLSGVITDASGRAIPGATVTLSDTHAGFSRTFTTGPDGRYSFTLVSPGTYTLKAEKTGFRVYSQVGVVLAVGETASQNITMEVGAITQQVTVHAAAPILNTSNANIASTVTGREAVELPLDLRNVYGLVSLNSSVNNSQQNQALNGGGQTGDADQDIAFFNFGGGRFGTTAFLLDGAWDAAGDWGGIVYVPSVDDTGEFKIQTNAFTAQYGWSMGNVVNAVTKSGTSSFHGDAWEFVRNSAWDANFFFNNSANIPLPEFARNQFGFTMGGPLYIPKIYKQRDKTFIFGEFEGLREAQPVPFTGSVPTTAMRGGDFSGFLGPQIGTDALGRPILSGQIYNPFTTRQVTQGQVDPVTGLTATQSGFIRDPIPGNKIPTASFDPVAQKLLQYWPLPTGPGTVNNYSASGGVPSSQTDYSIRVDQNISDKSRMFARWSQKFEYKQQTGDFFGTNDPGGPGTLAPDDRLDGALGYNHVFSPTTVMSVDLGWARWVEGRVPQGVPFDPSIVGLPSALNAFGGPGAFPSITIEGETSLGSGVSNSTPREDRSYSIDFTKVAGAHTLDIGFMGVGMISNSFCSSQANFGFSAGTTEGPNPVTGNPATGEGFASFLLGTGSGGSGVSLTASAAFEKNFEGWYVQDDWKVKRNLTLNLGLRYDFQTAVTDRFNRLSWFNPAATNPISSQIGMNVPGELVYTSPSHRGVYNPQYTNLAPRVSFAYSPISKMVMRGGFGMFYIPAMEMGDYQGLSLYGYSQNTPYVASVNGITPTNLLSNPFPGGLLLPTGNSLGSLTNEGFYNQGPELHQPTPYIEQWAYGIQYAISPNTMLNATYVGNHGVKLLLDTVQGIDELPTADLALGDNLLQQVANPFAGHITQSGCGLNDPTIVKSQLLLPYPEYCGVGYTQPPEARSSYNALQLSFRHRWSSGLQMLLSYTNSKYLDDSDGPEGWTSGVSSDYESVYNLRNEYAPDIDDIPQSFVASYIYQLPVGRGRHFGSLMSKPADALIGGWQVSGLTTAKEGFPLGLTAATNNLNNDGGTQRPNIIGNPHLSNPTVNEWFNTAAFGEPAPFTFGNAPRTMPNLRAPGLYDWDIAAEKYFSLSEKARLQFRAEFFNAFNRVNLYAPSTSFGAPGFGVITLSNPPRDIQFALKLLW
ncbi:MAG: carboxypeptidase-like regulatory domain-containing protein [Terriglobia bacterium]